MTAPLTDAWVDDDAKPAPRQAPVASGAALLDDVRAFLARFVTFPSQAALDITTAWAVHTHFVDCDEHLLFMTSPRLVFVSDQPASGKTRAMEMALLLSARGQQVLDPTPGSFATMINEERATIGIDEIDILFGAGGAKAVLRSLLNGGYRKGAKWPRMNKASLPVFSAVTMSGLGRKFRSAAELAPLRSRSIIIDMVPGSPPERYRTSLHEPTAKSLREALTRWGARNLDITEAIPDDIPEGIDDRLLEVSEPLFVIADRAGGHWPQTIREAARQLLLGEGDGEDEASLSERLIADLAVAFGVESKMSRVALTEALYDIPGSPWAKLWPSRQSAPAELSALLAPLGVSAVPVRLEAGVVRGYKRSDFAPLWLDLGIEAAASEPASV